MIISVQLEVATPERAKEIGDAIALLLIEYGFADIRVDEVREP
jgi:hypothetical protein